MKDRKIIFLSVLVASIWSFIGFKIYINLKSNTVDPIQTNVPKSNLGSKKDEPYTLVLAYRDPFLHKVKTPTNPIYRKKILQKAVVKSEKRVAVAQSTIHWERCQYLGSIYNASRNSYVATIKIDGVEKVIKAGEAVGDFTINEITIDSIRVTCQDSVKYLGRKK